MLQAAPPGYSPFAINRQSVQGLLPTGPGSQQLPVLGQPAQTAGAPPSSYLPPSSQPLAPAAGSALSAANAPAIIRALAARGGR